jgi:crossover junction endodeoxyribonuclease RuvC
MRVIGIDPGNAVTGYGIVERRDGSVYIASGVIRSSDGRGPRRLAALYAKLLNVIDEHAPSVLSLERSFVAINVQSAFTLGEARAVAMLAAAHRELEVFEYTPTDVKLTIAGHGRAGKEQVKRMVRQTLMLGAATTLTNDASDALAIALCHLFRSRFDRAAKSSGGL